MLISIHSLMDLRAAKFNEDRWIWNLQFQSLEINLVTEFPVSWEIVGIQDINNTASVYCDQKISLMPFFIISVPLESKPYMNWIKDIKDDDNGKSLKAFLLFWYDEYMWKIINLGMPCLYLNVCNNRFFNKKINPWHSMQFLKLIKKLTSMSWNL